jgi:hypothetical protein
MYPVIIMYRVSMWVTGLKFLGRAILLELRLFSSSSSSSAVIFSQQHQLASSSNSIQRRENEATTCNSIDATVAGSVLIANLPSSLFANCGVKMLDEIFWARASSSSSMKTGEGESYTICCELQIPSDKAVAEGGGAATVPTGVGRRANS